MELRELKAHGITVDTPQGNWEHPNSPAAAGLLNILPGFGYFYLAMGNNVLSRNIAPAFL